MKWAQAHIFTLREAPSDAEIDSHKLLVRGGFVRKLGPGLYTYQNLALRAIRKVENVIRDVLDTAGCTEVLMPMVQPRELWEESGRWESTGDILLKFQNRNLHWFCLGPTHEEVITDLVRKDVKSYRDLPRNIYQIQTKYRDEIRPRFGLMRGREFIMKDAYSFDRTREEALKSYEVMYQAYKKIFSKLGLNFRIVQADAGNIGGSQTHEFQVLADAGEDHLMVCDTCDFAANIEVAPVVPGAVATPVAALAKEKFSTPGLRSIDDLSKATGISTDKLVKTMFFETEAGEVVTVLLRGSDEVNAVKLKNVLGGTNPPNLLNDVKVKELTGASPGSCGPVGVKTKVYADNGIKGYCNFIVGANEDDFHLKNINFDRDFKVEGFFDIRSAKSGDACPQCGKGHYQSFRGIEVGHVFYLGTKYSKSLQATYLDTDGKSQVIEMGCYGIGVSRTVQAAIEQNHDNDGIIWNYHMAPYHVHVCLLDPKDAVCSDFANKIESELEQQGYSVLIDDRDERPGVKFKDADLIGMPLRVIVGGKGMAAGQVEVVERKTKLKHNVPTAELVSFLNSKITEGLKF